MPARDELRDDLERFLDGRPIHGRPVSRASGRTPGRSADRRWPCCWRSSRSWHAGCFGGVAAWIRSLERHNRQLSFRDRPRRPESSRGGKTGTDRPGSRAPGRPAPPCRRAFDARQEALEARQFELAQDILHEIEPELPRDHSAGFAWGFLWRSANREFTQLWGHESTVVQSLISADGTTLATADISGKILFWDAFTRAWLWTGRVPQLVEAEKSRRSRSTGSLTRWPIPCRRTARSGVCGSRHL